MIVLVDDAAADRFAPFALTRPAAALLAGGTRLADRWAAAAGTDGAAFVAADRLAAFAEEGLTRAADPVPGGTVVAWARAVPGAASRLGAATTAKVADRVAAVRLARDTSHAALRGAADLAAFAADGPAAVLGGWWLDRPWDLIGTLPAVLADDAADRAARLADGRPRVTVLGDGAIGASPSATIEPYVTVDARGGAVAIEAGAHVEAYSRLVGPCVIGAGTVVHGGRVAAVATGPQCRVHGDVSHSLFLGYANKAHEGFVGHSVIGRWANLGAGTTTSNLKNSYGAVQMWAPDGVRGTGLTFLGSLIGDHAKLGIGTMLTTGTVVGAGANVFGASMPPKVVPPFAWGSDAAWETWEFEKFVAVAGTVFGRRGRTPTATDVALWRAAFDGRGAG
jgi:UDP-N-acetylglucosamine diphosphorylase/glucosamine-1-phosphate N-acetyltransferase